MLLSVSWRNIWRNKKRSLIIIGSISVGLAGGMLTIGFSNDMVTSVIKNGIETKYSHVQIHHPDLAKDYDVNLTIPNGPEVFEKLGERKDVVSESNRVVSPAMLSSATGSYGLMVYGVTPEKEKQTTNLYTQLVEGKYLESSQKNGIIISRKIADQLKVKLGSKVRLMFQNKNHELTAGSFRIKGLFKTNDGSYDINAVFVNRTDLAGLLELGDQFHEISIKTTSDDHADSLVANLKVIYPNLKIESWSEIAPELDLMRSMSKNMLFIILGIIMLALMFGITNTMLMSVIDRTRELGVLMAIGMNRRKVFSLIVIETIFLSLTGGLFGSFISWLILFILSFTGLDLSIVSEGLKAFGSSTILYPHVLPDSYLILSLMMVLTSLIAAIYPALKAIRLNPSTAIRTY